MKRFITSVCLLLLLGCASRRSEPIKREEFITDTAELKNGEKQFMRFCQKCHPAGEAGLGPSLNSNPAPSFVKRFQVRHGLGVMPAFDKDEISRDDLRDIVVFLRDWKNY